MYGPAGIKRGKAVPVPEVVAVGDEEGDRICLHLLLRHLQAELVRHLLDDDLRFFIGIIPQEHLALGEGAPPGAVSLDVLHAHGLYAEGMVDQNLRVDAECFVERIVIDHGSPGDVVHREQAHGREPAGAAAGDHPEVRDRPVVPEELAVAVLVQDPDKVRGMFGGDVQRDLGQIQIRPDPAGGADPCAVQDGVHDLDSQLLRRHLIHVQIVGHVDK